MAKQLRSEKWSFTTQNPQQQLHLKEDLKKKTTGILRKVCLTCRQIHLTKCQHAFDKCAMFSFKNWSVKRIISLRSSICDSFLIKNWGYKDERILLCSSLKWILECLLVAILIYQRVQRKRILKYYTYRIIEVFFSQQISSSQTDYTVPFLHFVTWQRLIKKQKENF